MEDDLNFFKWKTTPIYLEMEDNLKKIIHPKTIKSKNNGCGTAPGNLVNNILSVYMLQLVYDSPLPNTGVKE